MTSTDDMIKKYTAKIAALESINKGFILIIISCFFYASMNSMIKYLGHGIDPLVLVFYRSLFAMLILSPIVFFRYKKDFAILMQKGVLLPNLLRGCVGFVGTCFWFVGLSNMNITECVALSFTTPLFIMLFSILFLKEKAGIQQWLLLIIGFCAAIFIKMPDAGSFNQYSIFVIFAAALWATSAVIVKKFVIAKSHPAAIVFFTSIITTFLSAPTALTQTYNLEIFHIICFLFLAIMMLAAQILAAFAYKCTQLSFIIPLDFLRLFFTGIIAYFAFDEIMSERTIIGAAIIIASSSYLIYLHNRKIA